jgi:hypothetical protein
VVGSFDVTLGLMQSNLFDLVWCNAKRKLSVIPTSRPVCVGFVEVQQWRGPQQVSNLPWQWLVCPRSVTLIETAHAHAMPRTTSSLMVVL